MADNIYLYLFVGLVFFICGLLTMVTRKNAIGMLMGVELVLNAAGLNFVAFQSFMNSANKEQLVDGYVFTLFIIILAAIEAAVAFAIVIRYFASRKTIDTHQGIELRG